MADIFISYLRQDWQPAARLAATLERAGFSVSWDFPSWVGEDLVDAIDRERASARVVIVLWSRESIASARIKVEALAALRTGQLVQARLSRVEAPSPFRGVPLVDLVSWAGNPEAPEIDVLRGLIARSLHEPNRPTLLSLGVGAWRFPVQARMRQVALCALPFLAFPIAVSGAKGLSDYLITHGFALERITGTSESAKAAPMESVIDGATLLDQTGICRAPASLARDASGPSEREADAQVGSASEAAAIAEPESLSNLIYAAMRKDTEAQYRLALRYLDEESGEGDAALGLAWLEKAADDGHTGAQMELASLALSENGPMDKNPMRAAAWYERAAESGNADAQYNLAVLLMSGQTGERDPAKARLWFEKAAEQGLVDASYNLGVIYANGWGIKANHTRAVTYLSQAADSGRADAAWALGLLHHEGDERVRDKGLAAHWFQVAAQANHPNAQFVMSILHIKGEGVIQSNPLAYVWLELATANGADQEALRADLTAVMTDLQAAAALDAVAAASKCLGLENQSEKEASPIDLLS